MLPLYEVPLSPPTGEHEEQQVPIQIKFSLWDTFKHHIPRFIVTMIIDVILPLVIYLILQKYIRPVYALLAASSPPLLMVIFKAVWLWTFDALGFVVFITFALSAVVAIITRNPFVLLLEKSLATGMISLVFGITLIPFQCCKHRCRWRPLAYYFYQDLVPTKRADIGLPDNLFNDQDERQNGDNYARLKEEMSIEKLSDKQEVAQVYEWIYAYCPSFRLSCYLVTSIWSVGLLTEVLARIFLILIRLPINKIVIYGHLILSLITTLLIILTVICITTERKHTLAFIEQWRIKHLNVQQTQRPSEMSTSSVIINCDSNCIVSVDA